MKCRISVEWRDGEEEVELTREKVPPEMWVSPVEGGWRGVQQVLDTLYRTYADMRSALIAALPKEVRPSVGIMVRMTEEQARDFTGGQV